MQVLNVITRLANNNHAKDLADKEGVNLNDVIVKVIQTYSDTYSDTDESQAIEFIVSQVIKTLTATY